MARSQKLFIFLNGLVLPRAAWFPIHRTFHFGASVALASTVPPLLAYDRYGQGESDPDPTDPGDTPCSCDTLALIADLHQLLVRCARDDLRISISDLRLTFVRAIPLAVRWLACTPPEHSGRAEGSSFWTP